MKRGVFAVAGQIGSGKTSVARILKDFTLGSMVSFSRVISDLASAQGMTPSRDILQTIGANIVKESPEQFCKAVLHQARWSGGDLVIDGLRHPSIASTLRSLVSPVGLWIIYVEASVGVRQRRIIAEVGVDALQQWDARASERFVTELRVEADMIVTNEGSIEDLRVQVTEWLAT